jgi:hypothetical protein
MRGDLGIAPFVVPTSLLATMDAADGEPLGLVEERNRLIVLSLAVFDHQVTAGVVRINRQAPAQTLRVRIPEEPVEGVLPKSSLAKNLVAEIQDIVGVADAVARTIEESPVARGASRHYSHRSSKETSSSSSRCWRTRF